MTIQLDDVNKIINIQGAEYLKSQAKRKSESRDKFSILHFQLPEHPHKAILHQVISRHATEVLDVQHHAITIDDLAGTIQILGPVEKLEEMRELEFLIHSTIKAIRDNALTSQASDWLEDYIGFDDAYSYLNSAMIKASIHEDELLTKLEKSPSMIELMVHEKNTAALAEKLLDHNYIESDFIPNMADFLHQNFTFRTPELATSFVEKILAETKGVHHAQTTRPIFRLLHALTEKSSYVNTVDNESKIRINHIHYAVDGILKPDQGFLSSALISKMITDKLCKEISLLESASCQSFKDSDKSFRPLFGLSRDGIFESRINERLLPSSISYHQKSHGHEPEEMVIEAIVSHIISMNNITVEAVLERNLKALAIDALTDDTNTLCDKIELAAKAAIDSLTQTKTSKRSMKF